MATYISPTSGQVFPDINTDETTQVNGSPPVPGSSFAGPLLSGVIPHSDGSGTLAGVGGQTGTANRGWVHMTQSCVCGQTSNTGTAGQFACPIVIPAQSQVTSIKIMVTTALTGGATTLGIGSSGSATFFTAASAVVTSGALGQVTVTPGTNATNIGNWDNVGTQDVQIVVLSTNTGTGVFTLTVEYVPMINLAS